MHGLVDIVFLGVSAYLSVERDHAASLHACHSLVLPLVTYAHYRGELAITHISCMVIHGQCRPFVEMVCRLAILSVLVPATGRHHGNFDRRHVRHFAR